MKLGSPTIRRNNSGKVAGDARSRVLVANNVVSLEKRRTSIDLSAQTLTELDALAGNSGTHRRTEALRLSLYLFSLLAGIEARGLTIFIRDANGKNSLFTTSLNALNGLLRGPSAKDGMRLTLELPARSLRELEDLRLHTGESKQSDVIRQAIHINWVLSNAVKMGRRVVVKQEDGAEYDLFVVEEKNHEVSPEDDMKLRQTI